jgi:DNA-binding CsgD family transcriptional regulator
MKLTRRELQVATLAAADLTNKEIAVELGISVHGVDAIWRKLKAKTETRGRAGAMIVALTGCPATDFRIYRPGEDTLTLTLK